jgi:hypothetical protein
MTHEEAIRAKDQAYYERNQLVAYLSRLYPSHLSRHPEGDEDWDRDWMTVVCVHIGVQPRPIGDSIFVELVEENLCWHIHDSEVPLFFHLEWGDNDWDGHSTVEKYQRLARLP